MNLAAMLPAVAGGLLIGLASTLLLALNGRIAGVSGIAGGVMFPSNGDRPWRAAFVAGLVAGGVALRLAAPGVFGARGHGPGAATLVLAGLLVGAGAWVGNGCTSGHGVCGLSRRSPRSLASVATFMATAMLVVWAVRHGR